MVRQGKYTKRVSPVRKAKRHSRRGWRWFKNLSRKQKIALIAGPILAFLIITPIATYLYYANDISDRERLMNRNNTGIVLSDRNGKVFYSVGRAQHRKEVKLADISDNIEHALVAAEDKDFYSHDGFSVTGIMRAFYNNILNREITGGGSTITQQLVKNTLLSEQQTFMRKYQELAMSIAIEQKYSKDEILEMYLNSAFFGGSVFGIDEASKAYFGKPAKDLDLAQSAMLIGILPAPNAYSPTFGNPEYAKERQTTVLSRMVTNGYISEAEKTVALAEKLKYAKTTTQENSVAPHFAQMVLDQLYAKYGEEKVIRSGYQVKTTLDLTMQKELKNNIANHISYIESNGGSNASGVAIDPKTGEVRALVGSADWENPKWGKVNMVTTPRQPGSSFKPIYYSQALADNVVTPATILHDEPTDFGGGYRPQNADRRFRGDVTVRNAISQSLNIPSIEVMQKLGISTSVDAAKRMGLSIDANKDYGLALALGTAEQSLLNMTNVYAAFANGGEQYSTKVIEEIDDKFGKSIFTNKNDKPKRVISAEGAFLVSNILSDNNARAPIFGSSLTVPGHTAAVKTGTTDDQRDAWTIGYTPQLAVGVWVGNNNNDTMLNGGSGMAGPIWVNTMQQALSGAPDEKFVVPAGVVQRPVCFGQEAIATRSGFGTYLEYFLGIGVPTATCSPQEPPKKEEKPKEDKNKDKKNDNNGNQGDTKPDTGTTDPTNPGDTTNPTDPGTGDGGTTPPPTP